MVHYDFLTPLKLRKWLNDSKIERNWTSDDTIISEKLQIEQMNIQLSEGDLGYFITDKISMNLNWRLLLRLEKLSSIY
jgi:hypothetical protein